LRRGDGDDLGGAGGAKKSNPRGLIVPDFGMVIAVKDDRMGGYLYQGETKVATVALPSRAGETEGRRDLFIASGYLGAKDSAIIGYAGKGAS
jgi:hypothetical protein